MVKLNYSVSAGIMKFPDGKSVKVGSALWWDWLESDKAKSFRFECDHGVKSYTARKERVKDLVVWYAYKSMGKLRKRYIGKSDQLTQERLELVAYDLEKEPQPRQKEKVLPNELGNEVGEYRELLNEARRIAVQRESDFQRLLEQKIRLQDEVKRLEEEIVHLKHQSANALPNEVCNKEVADLKERLKRLTQERDEFSQQIDELVEKTGELGLALQLKDEELGNMKRQLEKAITASVLHSEVGNSEIDSSTLFNQLRPLLNRLNDRERRAVQQKLEEVFG